MKNKRRRFVVLDVDLELCPFDGLSCDHVSSCDEVLCLRFGTKVEWSCSRAVVKVGKK